MQVARWVWWVIGAVLAVSMTFAMVMAYAMAPVRRRGGEKGLQRLHEEQSEQERKHVREVEDRYKQAHDDLERTMGQQDLDRRDDELTARLRSL